MATRDELLLLRARDLRAAGDLESALAYYRELCESEPYDPDIWLERADAAESAGLVREAVRSLFHVAELYARAGMAEAAEIAERVLALDPNHAAARQFSSMFAARRMGAPATAVMVLEGSGPHTASPAENIPRVPAPPASSPGLATVESSPELATIVLPSESGPSVRQEPDAESDGAPEPDGAPSAPADEQSILHKRQLVASLSADLASPLLSELAPAAVAALIDAGTIQRYRQGRVIFRQGDSGTSLYLILQGEVDVERQDPRTGAVSRLATLRAGTFFGEMALLANAPRSATMRVQSDAILLEVARESVQRMSQGNSRLMALLMRFFRARLVGTLMATSPLFQPLSAEERRALVSRFRLREVPEDHVLLRQGEPTDGLYLVLVGMLIVFIETTDGRNLELGRLRPGDVFGEMSVLGSTPATASIRTRERAWVLRLPREDVETVVRAHPEVLEQLSMIAANRLQQNRRTLTVPDTAPESASQSPSSPAPDAVSEIASQRASSPAAAAGEPSSDDWLR